METVLAVRIIFHPLVTIAICLGRFCLNLQCMWSMVKTESTFLKVKNNEDIKL
jgi:hypothetical protein